MKNKKYPFILKLIEKGLNKLMLREKIIGLFIFCVILPIVCTDGYILNLILKTEQTKELKEAETETESTVALLKEILTDCERIATSIRLNSDIGDFLSKEYESSLEFYDSYYNLSSNFFFQTLVGFDNTKVKVYTSNPTIISGGHLSKIDDNLNNGWYEEFIESGKDRVLICCYDSKRSPLESKRCLFYLQKLKYINNNYENFIRIEVDYSDMTRKLNGIAGARSIYICGDDNTVFFDNLGTLNQNERFEEFNEENKVTYKRELDISGNIKKIYTVRGNISTLDAIKSNTIWIAFLILINFVLPAFVLIVIDNSIIYRIKKLDSAFGKRENDQLVKIENPEGSDEIGNLMLGYNQMVDRTNQLIQIVYKDKLLEQEMTLAKQNAELLALHSQINPHFMFNALESIRMHSIIKGEVETAEMVEKLALMERQYVDWDSDMIEISKEMGSVEAYLGLQKYRFGDKLKYSLSVDEDCQKVIVPKLTIVTFVENACVHGMENKNTECYVFVRVYKEKGNVIIEVEDTGNGMTQEEVEEILNKARTIEMSDMKSLKHVGIYNAILRLKMTIKDRLSFDIDSEEGVGTMIQISIGLPSDENSSIS